MSVTTWTRIEPDILTGDPQADLAEGVAARLADPLWLLGRQWQMAELQGEDAGSPIATQIEASSFPIDVINTPPKSTAYSVTETPAEALIEHDGGPADLRMRAAGGTAFVDKLLEAQFTKFVDPARAAYGFTAQTAGVLEAILTSPGNLDGDRILAAAVAGTLAQTLSVGQADAERFNAVLRDWLAWYQPRASVAANPAWVPDRLEYKFSLSATVPEGRVTLTAPEHHGGSIDWDSFSAGAFVPGAPPVPKTTSVNVLPAVLQIPGMPSPWFWALEDSQFDTGRIEAGPSDTARMLLIEASMAYASDWFLLPLRLPVASLSRVDRIQVRDTFGVTTLIRSAQEVHPNAGWSLWQVMQGRTRLPYLVLPPPNTGFMTAQPIEEVLLVRDEAANLAWAHPTIPPGDFISSPIAGGSGDLVYVPVTPLPDDRFPLVMTETAGERSLVRAKMVDGPAGRITPLLPENFRVRDEELPDEGLTLRRRFELGRTPDGVLHLWISRAPTAGARIPSSGLTFDRLDPGDDSAVPGPQ